MRAVIFVSIAFLFCCALCVPSIEELKSYTFEQYKNEFKKSYSTKEEENMRRKIFEQRVKKILRHNGKKNETFFLFYTLKKN